MLIAITCICIYNFSKIHSEPNLHKSFKHTNAYLVVTYNHNQQSFKCFSNIPNNELYFEAASLSKTFLAARIYKANLLNNTDTFYINKLLHKTQNGEFEYSNENYTQVHEYLKKIGYSNHYLTNGFLFQADTNKMFIENCFVQDNKFFRPINKFSKTEFHGNLYLNLPDAIRFIKELREHVKLENLPTIMVDDFSKIRWAPGFAIDNTHYNNQIAIHWGSNWCFNSLWYYNFSKDISYLFLTNSIIGASEICASVTEIEGYRLQFFDYIGWY